MNHRSDRWDAHPSRESSLATCGFEAMIRAIESRNLSFDDDTADDNIYIYGLTTYIQGWGLGDLYNLI